MKLVLALYGHPDAGGFWAQHCEKALRAVGFEQCPNWKSVFRHAKLNRMLVVYVDDFKLSGPKANLAKGWQLIRSKINMEDAAPIKRYLGFEHVTVQYSVSGQFDPRSAWTMKEAPKKGFPELAASSATEPSAAAATTPAKAPNPENLTKEEILRDVTGVIWACGSQVYGLNRDPALYYALPSLSDMERFICKLTTIPVFAEKDISFNEGSRGGLPCIIPKIAVADATGPWNMWMSEFRKMYTFMVNPILTQAGKDSDSRPYSIPRAESDMKLAEWDMRVCLFAAHSLSPYLSVRIASAYAHGSSPPLGSAVQNKHVVVLHDGYLRFYNSSMKPKNDGYGVIYDDLNRAFSEAFKIGISCDSECIDPKDQTSGQVTLSEIVDVVRNKTEQATLANQASSTIILSLEFPARVQD